MDFKEQKRLLVDYFKEGEGNDEKIGIEVEHFVIEKKSLSSIDYSQNNGIESILYVLKGKGWKGQTEGNKLIGLNSNGADITLEPGGQLEIGTNPYDSVDKLKDIYFSFLEDIVPILDEQGYQLLTLGYHLKSKIDDIDWNPKRRYKIMSNYLGSKGKYAHNMMKGTAALQMAFDYKDEIDFVKKFRVANALSPLIAVLFDNSPVFEGEIYEGEALRTLIWANTDNNRTGVIEEAFKPDFGYESYADYILSREPILVKSNGKYIDTGSKSCKEIFSEMKMGREELEHILTMVFPDVRAKKFIEIRMADSLPPDYTFSLVAFWKGILYNQPNLDEVYNLIKPLSYEDILRAKEDIIAKGIRANIGDYSILDMATKLVKISKGGLKQSEIRYLSPFEDIIYKEETLATRVKRALLKKEDRALNDHIMNFLVEGRGENE
ncbi:glutamate--cysteine ligase [Halonatronum saccharophilum]|uniref:glutamate--cysteine ligase n=1 Tax=Halonatronum saccharophilum TaxID=150060 RepID=UPI000486B948|nr:glutamate-cysteine ligase family protein [Halonatronum saccharophilum]